jgi:sulfur-oxidizing protein SoxB
MRLNGKLLEASKSYKVAGWAPVAKEAASGTPVWEVVASWLKSQPRLSPRRASQPAIEGLGENKGLSSAF